MRTQNDDIMLSIIVITYNHERYIRKTLDSILAQKMNFPYEVLVQDDCSPDGTQEVLKEYARKYPDVFTVFLNKKNIGATRNAYSLIMKTRGKYLTTLEGDDYWCDPLKMQIQVDFLEDNPTIAGVTNACYLVDENDEIISRNTEYDPAKHWTYDSHIYSFYDAQRWAIPGQDSSWVLRNFYIDKKHDYSILYKGNGLTGDRTSALLISMHGDMYYMNRVMTHYRYVCKKGGTSWVSQNNEKNLNLGSFNLMRRLERYAREKFGFRYNIAWVRHWMLYDSIRRYRENPTKENSEVLKEIWKQAFPKTTYLLGAAKNAKNDSKYPAIHAMLKGRAYHTNDESMRKAHWSDLKLLLSKGCKLVLFGVGNACDDYVNMYGMRDKPVCIIDNNKTKWGTTYDTGHGILEVKRPDEVFKNAETKERYAVLITSTVYYESIALQLKEMGVKHYFSFAILEANKPTNRLYMNLFSSKFAGFGKLLPGKEAIELDKDENEKGPALSICIFAKGMSKYLRRCVSSIISQDFDDEIEILVGTIESDKSCEKILAEYEGKKHNVSIRLVRCADSSTDTHIVYALCKKARGSYISNITGNVFFIDRQKLKKQIGFLRLNRDMAGIFNAVAISNGKGSLVYDKRFYNMPCLLENPKPIYTFYETDIRESTAAIFSAIYKNFYRDGKDYSVLEKASDSFWTHTIMFLIAMHGDMFYMNRYMDSYCLTDRNTGVSFDISDELVSRRVYKKRPCSGQMNAKLKAYAKDKYNFPFRLKRFKSEKRALFDRVFTKTVNNALKNHNFVPDNEELSYSSWEEMHLLLSEGRKLLLMGSDYGIKDYLRLYGKRDHPCRVVVPERGQVYDREEKKYGIRTLTEEKLKKANSERYVILLLEGPYDYLLKERAEELGAKYIFSFTINESKKAVQKGYMNLVSQRYTSYVRKRPAVGPFEEWNDRGGKGI